YHIPAVPLSYHGLNFKVIAQNVASNVTYYATSSVATLTVNADTVAPVILSAQPAGLNQLVVSFSERLAVGSATTLANYSITGPGGSLIISNAVLDATQTNVVLTVSTMTLATAYTLTVNGITDLSAAANTVAANSQVQFTAAAIAFVDIGGPAIGGSVTTAGSGYRISGGGTNMTGSSDQFTFAYQLVAGDFDNKVRLDSLTARDAYAMAGLMARETLDANSRFAASMASPSLSGCFILQRSVADTGTAFGNNFPVNYPHTWLRLTRVGNVFTAYGGFDGQTWVQLGTVTIAMPSSVYFGYAVCGANTSQAASVELRDISSGLGGTVVPSLTRSIEPLSVSSRRTGLVISEIMYNPRNRTDNKDLAFIEIFNADPIFEDLSGYRLGGDAGYTFPTGTVLQAGSFIVVAASPLDVQSEYGITGVYGPWTNALSNSGGTVRLRNALDAVLLEVNYDTTAPWPLAADSAGHSLVLAQPSYGEDDSRAWAASDVIGGSPGRADSVSPEPLRNLVINEFLSRTVPPAEDFIELYNRGTTALDISGAWLSDSANTNKFRIPNGTVLPARGFAVFSETQLGFGLSSSGEKILLVSSNQNRVLDAWTFDSQDDAISSGRFPDGSVNIRELSALTPGAINAPPLQRSIVINELMFDPISGDEDDDYIELYNRGASTVNLGRWQFTAGVDYTFPANTLIAPGSYVVVAKNRNRMLANYANLNATNVFGNFDGSLRNNGERLALSMPDEIITTNGAVLATNTLYIVVNEVGYGRGGRWGQWSHGGGSSLELIDSNSDNRQVQNWADSDETAKSSWVSVFHQELMDHVYPVGTTGNQLNEVQIMILGAGEALVDDLEVHAENPTGPNLVANGTFASLGGWLIQGNHVRSSLEPAGPNNPSSSLRIRATSGGDNGANRVETDLTATLAANTQGSIRAKLRWLRGQREVLLRLH
ncbi:MAG TPA: lamin tail domain-containing protein, partial [Candidatus Limnocylindria bacterium]|nr:lamin tail domain-containing protein [Candidatus Limnocylindria bacterium]